ncbi:hypothetical protein [Deinococcus petrolearius]|uniref:Uncharacterized protein n=1 Tax=Deinococcus petrolearius TaxID=1751295 RepID=A0ABW1DN98_9DEIO
MTGNGLAPETALRRYTLLLIEARRLLDWASTQAPDNLNARAVRLQCGLFGGLVSASDELLWRAGSHGLVDRVPRALYWSGLLMLRRARWLAGRGGGQTHLSLDGWPIIFAGDDEYRITLADEAADDEACTFLHRASPDLRFHQFAGGLRALGWTHVRPPEWDGWASSGWRGTLANRRTEDGGKTLERLGGCVLRLAINTGGDEAREAAHVEAGHRYGPWDRLPILLCCSLKPFNPDELAEFTDGRDPAVSLNLQTRELRRRTRPQRRPAFR